MLKHGMPSGHAQSSVVLPAAAKSFGAESGHGRRLQLADRILIELGITQGRTPGEIASGLRAHRSTVFREIARHSLIAEDGRWGNHDAHYSAALAQFWADQARERPKAFKLETLPLLRRVVVALLDQKLSPQQVSVRLRRLFPDDKDMQISHETLYQALYVQGAGALRHELTVEGAIRSGRKGRIPSSKLPARNTRRWLDGHRLADREELLAAEHAGRKIPGHWEGDLVVGPNNSGIITLVERASRFTLLGRLPGTRDSATVIDVLTTMVEDLPAAVKRSITWDQGTEMAQHSRFTVATGCPVYFCDPHSPWQRPTNENLNGQLRWEYPKGTDFNHVTDDELRTVQDMLNARPRVILDGATPSETLDELITTVALTD
ncbi:MAG TPA: IS30 family transposase [Candidatus Nesterenkonia stercoripullorum]|uniref:IS30 family transposase n=1 Tax=Candidatus Nesterenkonia stercoripullorum TaxID=2838701 RepID=A0A9D1S163_9MICC|nr:IS30 family transposase [Candidatus Nesterenkonia stercoripullorum]